MALLVVFVLLALAVSFACSILEAVLLSVTPAYIGRLEQENHPAAPRLRVLKESVDRPLSAILSLNTVAHTVGAAGAGAQAATVFGSAYLGVFSAVLTLLILFLSEIIPKTLGAVHWRRLAPLVAPVLCWMVILMLPLVKLSEWLTDRLTPDAEDSRVSREEISAFADEGQKEGVVNEGETRVMKNVLRLAGLRVQDVMTPAEGVVSLSESMCVADVMKKHPDLPFSRIPLESGGAGAPRFTGYALKDEILECIAADEHAKPLLELRRELTTVDQGTLLPTVFDQMVERREHLALVLDGQTVRGLITMEDVIETLLGLEIHDEVDDPETLHELARAHWRKRADRLAGLRGPRSPEPPLGITGKEPARRAVS